MTTTLTDIERTLLSAYRDGELSSTERVQAETLLATSPVAREYLGDLQSLNDFSHAAFPAAATGGMGAGFGS
ncbi:MAG: hypothetical protein H7X80_02855, partial [bacterium]|nr:hypothetical protein [Candidatus Kapabacteria bacterium]